MSKFERIKKAVSVEKENKIKAEAKRNALTEEKDRLFTNLETATGKSFHSVEEAKEYVADMEKSIADDVQKMAAILDEEGIDY